MEQNVKVTMTKWEINRLNDVIQRMLTKIKEYEHEWEYFEERRWCINAKFPMHQESEDDVFNRGFKKGFQHGFAKG